MQRTLSQGPYKEVCKCMVSLPSTEAVPWLDTRQSSRVYAFSPCLPSSGPCWLCRDACSSLLTLAHASVRMKVLYRYLCHQSLLLPWVSGKSNPHLLLNNGFSWPKKHFLLCGREPAAIFCQLHQRGRPSLLCVKRGMVLAAPTTYFCRNPKQISWHRLIFPVSKEKTLAS